MIECGSIVGCWFNINLRLGIVKIQYKSSRADCGLRIASRTRRFSLSQSLNVGDRAYFF